MVRLPRSLARRCRPVTLTILLLAAGCDSLPSIGGPGRVVRFGEAGDYARRNRLTLPTLATSGAETVIYDLAWAPRGVLSLAVAGTPQDEVAFAPSTPLLRCMVQLWRLSRPWTRTIALLDVSPDQKEWTEVKVDFPGAWRGRLTLSCTDHPDATRIFWAQPVLVPRHAREAPPLVVLVSLDTMRADYMEGFGGVEGSTPNLRKLGGEGMRFVNATAESTWTLHSHFAMLYSTMLGLPPREKPIVSLAQAFADQGYVTTALTGGGFMSRDFQFHRGFDRYVEHDARPYQGAEIKVLPQVLEEASDVIAQHADAASFLFLHTYAVHQTTEAERQWTLTHGDFVPFTPTSTQIDDARAFYGDLVRQTDQTLAPFFERLRIASRSRPVIVVVTSDHGEAFGEHENFRHGWGPPVVGLYDEVSHVPMIIWSPGFVPAGSVSHRPVMLMDIPPSLLSSREISVPPSMRGDDLWPLWAGGEGNARAALAHQREPLANVSYTQNMWSLRTPTHKLIVDAPRGGIDTFKLYDLSVDPDERDDIAPKRPLLVTSLLGNLRGALAHFGLPSEEGATVLPRCPRCEWDELHEFWKEAFPTPDVESSSPIDPETTDRLRALGYVQ